MDFVLVQSGLLLRLSKAGDSRERKSKPFVPTTALYFIHFSRKIRQIIHGCSKVCFETRFKVEEFLPPFTSPPPHGGFRVSFLASTRGPNVDRSFVPPLASHRVPKLESANGVLDFEFFGISPLPIHLLQISLVSHTDEKFFLHVFQKLRIGTAVNAPL
ncbi:hypothetical protein AVEN_253125-1 [Araneus ventricosus]|uniref:Uncharacterized protein n=1 Tax=Araneus ventricosus TaxID=182803 RepID=A0A4Y2HEF1_ARAVE|nr:hypothetical protein AVEN_253125-1 [Araneus ventricosus]